MARLGRSDSIWRGQDHSGVFLTSFETIESEEPPGMQVPLHRSQGDFPAESRTSPPLNSSPGQGKGFTTTGEFLPW